MNKELIAYAAGLFDGEGYVTIPIMKRSHGDIMQIRCGIAMTHPMSLKLMHSVFGGSLHLQGRHKPTHKPLHQWVISSQKAATFLRLIRPLLIVKADEVDVALKFQANVDEWNHKLGNRYGFSPERDRIFAYRKELSLHLRQLKLVVTPLT